MSRHVVDSSAWLEYFADGPNAAQFAEVIEHPEQVWVPTITLLEVYKRVSQQRGESLALQCVAVMQQGTVIDLDAALALRAATLALRHRLPLADCIIYASAQAVGAVLWTQNADFEGLAGVEYRAKSLT